MNPIFHGSREAIYGAVAQALTDASLAHSENVRAGCHSYATGLTVVQYWSSPGVPQVGKFTSIAGNVVLLNGGEHFPDHATTSPLGLHVGAVAPDWFERSKGPIIIGNDVWVGHGAIILSGVTLGDGAVVGAGSVVDADVPPYGVVCGNRAVLRRKRFGDAVIERLLSLKWWDWPYEKLLQHHKLLTTHLNEQILSQLEEINDE